MGKAIDFLCDETGAASVEYAMLAALVALMVAVGAGVLGQNICAFLNGIGTALSVVPTGPLTSLVC